MIGPPGRLSAKKKRTERVCTELPLTDLIVSHQLRPVILSCDVFMQDLVSKELGPRSSTLPWPFAGSLRKAGFRVYLFMCTMRMPHRLSYDRVIRIAAAQLHSVCPGRHSCIRVVQGMHHQHLHQNTCLCPKHAVH